MKEKGVGIKKIIKRVTVIAGIITVLMFSSCKDSFEYSPGQSGMARVTISVTSNNGRTVWPVLPETAIYKLFGYQNNNESDNALRAEFSTQETTIYLPIGTWNFTLKAFIGNDPIPILQGVLPATISNNANNNILAFELSPVGDIDGTGKIEITFEYPSAWGITEVTATSDKPLPEMGEPSGIYEQTFLSSGLEFNTASDKTRFTFAKNEVPSDDYLISFEFYNADGHNALPIRVVSELVIVRKGLTSKDTIEIKTYTVTVEGSDLNGKLDWIRDNAESNIEYIVNVTAPNTTLATRTLSSTAFYNTPQNVIVTLNGGNSEKTITLSNTETGSMFTVESGVTLVLDNNITLQGLSSNTAALVSVNEGGLEMNTGSKITYNKGGGVYVSGDEDVFGTFTMSGGEIYGNGIADGTGGVFVAGGGTFNMSGGYIYNNNAADGGGVYVGQQGTFTMNGGQIYGNTAANNGGGVYVSGYGTFTKTTADGIIYGYDGSPTTYSNNVVKSAGSAVQNNKGHAVYVANTPILRREDTVLPSKALYFNGDFSTGQSQNFSGKWVINAQGNSLANKLTWIGTQSHDNVEYFVEVNTEILPPFSTPLSYTGRNNVTIILNGGDSEKTITLSGNGSMFTVGNGVTLVLDKNITLQGINSSPFNNAPLVTVNSGGKLEMLTISTITNNINTSSNGGGVYVKSGGTFTMNGGTISENQSSEFGGGVFVNGAFTMLGGFIYHNSAEDAGGGVYVENGTFNMVGGNIVINTTNGAGGGVYVSGYGTFTKEGGIIYGTNDNSQRNYAASGHAVYVASSLAKYRDTTVGPNVYLSYDESGTFTGDWNSAFINVTIIEMTEWDLLEKTVVGEVYKLVNIMVKESYRDNNNYTYKWYLNGVVQAGAAINSLDFYPQAVGIYEIVVVVTNINGEKRSGSCQVIVE